MKWNPYQDQENRAYSSIVTSFFPEQTKSIPRLLCWSIVFLLDLVLIIGCAFNYGLMDNRISSLLFVLLTIVVFWLQGFLWSSIIKLFGQPIDKD